MAGRDFLRPPTVLQCPVRSANVQAPSAHLSPRDGSRRNMDSLDQLEQQSVYIQREANHHNERQSKHKTNGKNTTVLLWLARKAFFGHVPFPLVHIDTSYKLPEMIAYRDRLALEYKLQMVVGQDGEAIAAGRTFPLP